MTRLPRRNRAPERVEQQHIVQLLRSLGAKVWTLGTVRRTGDYQGTMQSPGLPDVIAFLKAPPTTPNAAPRRLLVVEVKAAGGRLRPEQAEFRAMCVASGTASVVGGLDAVIAWLIAEGHLTTQQVPHYRTSAAEAST